MNNVNFCFTSAVELKRMFSAKQLSPVELIDAVLERIDRLNPRLNAFCLLDPDGARTAARQAERAIMQGTGLGLLHGLPISIKDLAMTKGLRTASGSHIFANRIPDADAPVVERLRAAGAILIGKTCVPEFGWKALSDSPLTGITRNPWNPAMTAGGSSSGAAVAAAAGLGPLHHGSDGAGSIRIPAAFCGVFGFKPSFGRVPYHPTPNNDNASHIGPLTRTVADGALMLAAMAGADDRDRFSLEGSPDAYVAELDAGIKGLKVGFSQDLGYLSVDDDIASIVANAASAFADLGCHLDSVDPGFDDSRDLIEFMWCAHEAGHLADYLSTWKDKMDPGLVACVHQGLHYSAVEYIRMRARKLQYWDKVRAFFQRYDLLLTPATSVAAFPVGRLNPEHYPQHDWNWLQWAGFSYPFNFTGLPAASVPCGFTPSGLPVGLQIVGRRFADLTVLKAARAFEQARPWALHFPALD
ncbi:MAG: amidase [Gammaproteobacteria bacterium]